MSLNRYTSLDHYQMQAHCIKSLQSIFKKDFEVSLGEDSPPYMHQRLEKRVLVEDKKEQEEKYTWEPIKLDSIIQSRENHILINISGMGKTTFLRKFAVELLNQDKPEYYPLFMSCADLTINIDRIKDTIKEKINGFYGNSSIISQDWSNLYLLLDGLDQAGDNARLLAKLQTPLERYGIFAKARILVSSRPSSLGKFHDIQPLKLCFPNKEQIKLYFGPKKYDVLTDKLGSLPESHTVPIILELLRNLLKKPSSLDAIESRSDLYQKFIDNLIDTECQHTRHHNKTEAERYALKNKLQSRDFQEILEELAFLNLAEGTIKRLSLTHQFRKMINQHAALYSGLLTELLEENKSHYEFRHQSFQAYYAAQYIYHHPRRRHLVKELTSNFSYVLSAVWSEVLEFYAGLLNQQELAFAARISHLENVFLYNWLLQQKTTVFIRRWKNSYTSISRQSI